MTSNLCIKKIRQQLGYKYFHYNFNVLVPKLYVNMKPYKTFKLYLFKNKKDTNLTWRELVKTMRDKLKVSQFSQRPQLSCGTFIDIDQPIFI